MELNKAIGQGPIPREEHIRQTIVKSKDIYSRQEETRLMPYREFLWTQLAYTRKRWWALQTTLLALACIFIPSIDVAHYRLRSAGVIGCLFVVLMIPELWRNKETDSTQVEAACLYSLRQVYSARITLFGMVDTALLTVFSLCLGSFGFTMIEVVSQFLLPVAVTACICFSILCGKQNWSEVFSITACLIWSGAWWLLISNEWLYVRIAPVVWAWLFGIALVFLAFSIRRAVRTTNQIWEVAFS